MDSLKAPDLNIYKPLRYSTTPPVVPVVDMILKHILNNLCNKNNSKTAWKNMKRFELKVTNNKNGNTEIFFLEYNEMLKHLLQYRKFQRSVMEFPKFRCNWLDGKSIYINFYMPDKESEKSLALQWDPSLGEKFPLKPKIDREGATFSSMQGVLQSDLIRNWYYLVDHSEDSLKNESAWLSTFMSCLNTCISLVEITLIQLYYKAKYDSEVMEWEFDEVKLGSTICRKLTDKFKWIGRITGRPLDNAELEMKSFIKLKNLRNHLNHFDPPMFAYTIEDIAEWLSMVSDIGKLIIKIRNKMGANLSDEIVEIALFPKIEFIPHHPEIHRYKQRPDSGYGSCTIHPV